MACEKGLPYLCFYVAVTDLGAQKDGDLRRGGGGGFTLIPERRLKYICTVCSKMVALQRNVYRTIIIKSDWLNFLIPLK